MDDGTRDSLRGIGTGQEQDKNEREQLRAELGEALGELKAGIDEVLAEARERLDDWDHRPAGERTGVTPDAGGALLALLGSVPRVIGNSLSGDEERVGAAREKLSGLDGRLRAAGIELGDGLTGFADRLAGLRRSAPAEHQDSPDHPAT